MAKINKISATLSVAATVLLEACSSSGGDSSGPTPVPNTTAPQLLATWATDCIITQNTGSTTVTQASGGGGGGSIAGGEAYRSLAVFNQDGRVEFSTEYYATANCNTNTLAGTNRYNAVYFVGGGGQVNDGGPPVTEIDISDARSTTYSIFRVVIDELYLGETTASSPDMDGSGEATRLDGLGPRMLKR